MACVGLLWNRPSDAWLGITPSIGKSLRSKERNEAFSRLVADHRITELTIDGLQHPVYMETKSLYLLEEIIYGQSKPDTARILAPLDNMLWDRKLIGDRLVARFEPKKTDSPTDSFIENWWWESHSKPSPDMLSAIEHTLKQFACYLNGEVQLRPACIWIHPG